MVLESRDRIPSPLSPAVSSVSSVPMQSASLSRTDSEGEAVYTAEGIMIPLGIEPEEVFLLIDRILPLEVCLYHRVLPLYVESGTLILGMVDSADEIALEYATRMASYHHYPVNVQALAGAVHQTLLSAYLNRVSQPALEPNAEGNAEICFEAIEQDFPEAELKPAVGAAAQTTLTAEKPDQEPDQAEQQIAALRDHRFAQVEALGIVDQRATLLLDATQFPLEPFGGNLKAATERAPSPGVLDLPELPVAVQHLLEPMEAIATLPPPQFLAELLGRALSSGSRRLLLGSNGGCGRIAWDPKGVAQIALDPVEPEAFQGLVAELKQLAGLALEPVQPGTRRILMRSFQGQPVMLKLSFEPMSAAPASGQARGEKVQLEILRGSQLIAHEQQRLEALEREAIATAECLQQQLFQLRAMVQALPALTPDWESLSQLQSVVQHSLSLIPTQP